MDKNQSAYIYALNDQIRRLTRINNVYGYVFGTWVIFGLVVPVGPLLIRNATNLSDLNYFVIYIGGAIAIWIAKSIQGRNIKPLMKNRERKLRVYDQE